MQLQLVYTRPVQACSSVEKAGISASDVDNITPEVVKEAAVGKVKPVKTDVSRCHTGTLLNCYSAKLVYWYTVTLLNSGTLLNWYTGTLLNSGTLLNCCSDLTVA